MASQFEFGEPPNTTPEVPAPPPPSAPGAWYAPAVHAQYEVSPGVVATVRATDGRFRYRARVPALGPAARAGLARVRDHFDGASLSRPRTRQRAAERMAAGLPTKYRRTVARLVDLPPAARRRLRYHLLAELRCLGELTPHALDDRVEVVDRADDGTVVVHLEDYAPARTGVIDADRALLARVASDRVARYEVAFHGFEIPVVLYRERTLGGDPFETKYAVREPDLLPGDRELLADCEQRIWESSIDTESMDDPAGFVADRARELLSRRLTARNTREWLAAARYRVRTALSAYGLAVPPVDRRYAEDRLDDLVYYALRDFVGYGKLTVPIRDPHLEDVEANRVGERVKVVPRSDLHDGRVPTNLAFDDETEFVNVVTQMAAADGTELSASTPSAKVNLDPPGVDETIRCAVALPSISEDGPHVSIRKQAADAMTPGDLVDRNSISVDLVALLWMLYEHRGVVLFSGPTGVGKTTLMNAHMPFVAHGDRPISIDEGSREVRLPHETGVSLTTREHQQEFKRVSMADLMTEANYLNPDLEVIAEINTPASFETFGEVLQTGHGVIGTTHAEDTEKLVNRVVEQGLPAYLLREIDLVVFPRHVGGERYVAEVVEFLSEADADRAGTTTIEKDGTAIPYRRVAWRDTGGSYHLAGDHDVLDRIAARTDRPVETVRREFERKRGYVEYIVDRDVRDFDRLFAFLADLRTEEAATVERERRRLDAAGGADGE